jgi:hypothetical protein
LLAEVLGSLQPINPISHTLQDEWTEVRSILQEPDSIDVDEKEKDRARAFISGLFTFPTHYENLVIVTAIGQSRGTAFSRTSMSPGHLICEYWDETTFDFKDVEKHAFMVCAMVKALAYLFESDIDIGVLWVFASCSGQQWWQQEESPIIAQIKNELRMARVEITMDSITRYDSMDRLAQIVATQPPSVSIGGKAPLRKRRKIDDGDEAQMQKKPRCT